MFQFVRYLKFLKFDFKGLYRVRYGYIEERLERNVIKLKSLEDRIVVNFIDFKFSVIFYCVFK